MSPASFSAGTHADSIPFPSGSYRSSDEFFEPLDVPKSLRDVALFIGTLIFIGGFGIGFFCAVIILLGSNLR